jgi:GAF domain-containing protein
MMPADEANRLRTLRVSRLLESGGDPRLDRIVRRAARLFEVAIAAISLLDETRQVFKASTGLGVPFTSREVAFCGHAILGTDLLIVLDAERDPRFLDNALVLGSPGIRFYAGAPVFGIGQQPLGALCVIDTHTRDIVTKPLRMALLAMAREASSILALPLPANAARAD